MGKGQQPEKVLLDLRRQPEGGERGEGSGGFEEAHHDFFAVLGWQGRDAKIDAARSDDYQEAAVLGRASFRDVHIGKYFEARDELVLHGARHLGEIAENAVHTDADNRLIDLRFDVNVARVLLHCAEDNFGGQADRGSFPVLELGLDFLNGVLIGLARAGGNELDVRQGRVIAHFKHAGDGRSGGGGCFPVVSARDAGHNFIAEAHPRGDFYAGGEAELVDRGHVLGLGHDDHKVGVVPAKRQDAAALREHARNQSQSVAVRFDGAALDVGNVRDFFQSGDQIFSRDEVSLQKHLAEKL